MSHGLPRSGIRFSGKESDLFVDFARRCIQLPGVSRLTIRGREPMTSSFVGIDGTPIEAFETGYRRVLRVRTDQGLDYQIGGTNTTKSIASDEVEFVVLPSGLVPPQAQADSVEPILAAVSSASTPSAVVLMMETLHLWVRGHGTNELLAEVIRNAVMPHASHASSKVRVAALVVLGTVGGLASLSYLTAALRDPVVEVRRQAALRLRGMDATIASAPELEVSQLTVNELSDVLLNDGDPGVRSYAAEDLGYFYNDRAQAALREALATDRIEDVRWACAVAIGRSNDLDAVPVLLKALRLETDTSIRKASLLGIGRHGPDLNMRSADGARQAVSRLATIVADDQFAGRDYAIHALGEFSSTAAPHLSSIISCLQGTEIEILSPAVTTISKLLPFVPRTEVAPDILSSLRSHLGIPAPTSWPGLGYYRAYQGSAGDLALVLEDFALAADYFGRAASAPDQPEWLRAYFRGASEYARAESKVSRAEPLWEALRLLRSADREFQNVADSGALAEGDIGRSGLHLKHVLARARLAVLSALSVWRPQLISLEDVERIQHFLTSAANLYRRLDLTNLSENQRSLSSMEAALINCLQMIVELLQEVSYLTAVLIKHDYMALDAAVSTVRSKARRLCSLAAATQSPSLLKVKDQVDNCLATVANTTLPIEGASEFVSSLPAALLWSSPTPGTCPVITFGEADLLVTVADYVRGDGRRDSPYLISSRLPLIFTGTVTVEHRSQDDELILAFNGTNEPVKDAVQYIPVHEGRYSLRPLDFGPVFPSSVARPYEFVLSFRNKGCLQVVSLQELWVRAFDPVAEMSYERSDADALKRRIADLRARLSEFPSGENSGGARQRALETELSDAMNLLQWQKKGS